ncbi:MAG: glycoside hydrolase family 97 protein [Bacteroidaceae bacterium]|nr:glycoside hydrolase family 97 protein [Bacteroidaceae bacterium]
MLIAVASVFASSNVAAKDYSVSSPDGHLKAVVSDEGKISWTIVRDDVTVLAPSAISIQTSEKAWGEKTKVQKARLRSIDKSITTVAYKRAQVKDQCNELTLECNGQFNLVVRAYNDGCAYRLVSKSKKPLRVMKEEPEFAFTGNYKAFIPYVNDNRGGERYSYSFESYYDEQRLSAMYEDSIAITPLAVCLPDGIKAVIMETGLENYPGMFLYRNSKVAANTLKAEFAPYPTETIIGGFNRLNLLPVKRADYIADIEGLQALPWRMVLVTAEDTQLLDTDTPYCLAPACRIEDTSWIKPGKVAWDWWNNWNIFGVDFRAGINTQTYKYYIDFAHDNGLEYIIVDEGWSSEEDLLQYSNDELSIPELVAYGKERNVGVILWTSWRNLIKDMDRYMSHYADAGVKGFKIDFFDRDDAEVMKSSYEIAAAAARYHLLVDYHGLKPTGLQRAYPNVVNFEGVKGLENCKWEQRNGNGPVHDMPRYDVSIPFLRMLPGPLDYTPGAMLNANRNNFIGNNDNPMSMGTRVHQMAMYTIFEAPLQMLADSPTHYKQNQECTDFIAAVPTTFDETIPLLGQMGEYVAIARRKGNVWYVAAMNNWTPRTLTIDCSQFLTAGMNMDSFEDGINADREATDYKHVTRKVSATEKITVKLAPAGGWTAIFR